MSEVIVLCEDKMHSVFITHFLSKRKRSVRVRHVLFAKPGDGDAADYVCKQYPQQLKSIRQGGDVSLIVMLDADKADTKRRRRQLTRACKQKKISPRKTGEKVAIFIPARAIETWIEFLKSEQEVDENHLYPKKYTGRENECKPQVKKLDEMCARRKLPANAPNSLKAACKEWDAYKAVL